MIENKSRQTLFVCDESSITCATFRNLQKLIEQLGDEVVLGIPGYEYQKGKRGWAKAQILLSVAPQVKAVLSLDYEDTLREIDEKEWKKIFVNGRIAWNSNHAISSTNERHDVLQITETSNPFDLEMIERTRKVIENSNCWLDPAGVIFTREGEILVESTSTSYNSSHCHDIPINFTDLPLNEGERMIFCDSLHAERVGISEAARKGIPLQGSAMYVSKFPCRPCAQSAIAAGVKTIVFEKGSYGLIETADLFEINNITLKKVII